MPASHATYRGRFAPSPTGPLHLGSLIAALASYLDARHHGGAWLIRVEDLDPPREEPGASEAILTSLRDHGLACDHPPLWQSQRHPAYQKALVTLADKGLLFRCDCTRAMLGPNGACGGRCEPRQNEINKNFALRLKVSRDTDVTFNDPLQGDFTEALGATLPDFVLRRKDGLYAYQLAVVVDDAFQGITHVVRGSDLLESTARQIYLQQCLGLPQPDYLHLPVITNAAGQKFSKQNHAPALQPEEARGNLIAALVFLNQQLPPESLTRPDDILAFATEHWSRPAIPAVMSVPAATG